MCTNCAPLIADLFLPAYEERVFQAKNNEKIYSKPFIPDSVIDLVLLLNNSPFNDFL